MSRSFDKTSTTEQVTEGIDLTGKTALVTGASSGLGAESARVLALRGAEVILTARNVAQAEGVAKEIVASTGNDRVHVSPLELGSFSSIHEAADRFRRHHDALHVLILNAGVMACPLERTEAGHELQLGTNHLGHFLFTCLLVPALRAGAPARVVSVSSAGHWAAGIDFEDPNFERRGYEKFVAYGQAKTANVLFASELDRRLQGSGVRAHAIHPGVIMTPLARHLTPDDITGMQEKATIPLEFKPVEAGAATQLYAATAPELDGKGGLYLEDCQISLEPDAAAGRHGLAPHARDPEAAARLWTLSEQLVGERFGLGG